MYWYDNLLAEFLNVHQRNPHSDKTNSFVAQDSFVCETKITSLFLIIIRNTLHRLRNTSNASYCRNFLILFAFILSKGDEANSSSEIYHCNFATIYIHNYLRNRKFPHFTSLGILDSDRMYRNIGRSSQREGKTNGFRYSHWM